MKTNLFNAKSIPKTGYNPNKPYTVYLGRLAGIIVYIGTTIQAPADRFRWHKHNGKDFNFEVFEQFATADEMLDLEFELIKKHKPRFNKITHRKQNLNRSLNKTTVQDRVGDKEWCQSCLKRHVNPPHIHCWWCSH